MLTTMDLATSTTATGGLSTAASKIGALIVPALAAPTGIVRTHHRGSRRQKRHYTENGKHHNVSDDTEDMHVMTSFRLSSPW